MYIIIIISAGLKEEADSENQIFFLMEVSSRVSEQCKSKKIRRMT